MIKYVLNGLNLDSSHGLLQYLGIKSQFIAEVIIYSSNIRSCFQTNFANRGGLIASISKYRPSNLQQLLTRWVRGGQTFGLRWLPPLL